MRKIALVFILGILMANVGVSQSNTALPDSVRMAWFNNAKFGIFMHWGVYSVGRTSESWPFFGGNVSLDEYMSQAKEFTAKNFDANKWAELFVQCGARYVVLTAMHCDGVALWDTKVNNQTIRNLTPCKRDLIAEYSAAMQKAGLKTGLYYSHVDWTSPDYMGVTQSITKKELEEAQKVKYKYSEKWNERNKSGYYNTHKFTPDEKTAWERFISAHDRQIHELMANYGKIDLLWFDFMYPSSGDFKWGEKALSQQLKEKYPYLVMNDRIKGCGDYLTAERGLPVLCPEGAWEYCETLSNRWGYMLTDTIYKTPRQLVRILVDCLAMGGNFLLDFGPKEDGTFDPEHVKRLQELGAWVKKHEDAVYNTKRGLLPGHYYGPTALSLDNKTLYIYLLDDPKDEIQIKGIRNKVKKATVVGYPDQTLKNKRISGADWANIPGIISINIPRELLDDKATVIKIEFDEPINLFREKGRDIINN